MKKLSKEQSMALRKKGLLDARGIFKRVTVHNNGFHLIINKRYHFWPTTGKTWDSVTGKKYGSLKEIKPTRNIFKEHCEKILALDAKGNDCSVHEYNALIENIKRGLNEERQQTAARHKYCTEEKDNTN